MHVKHVKPIVIKLEQEAWARGNPWRRTFIKCNCMLRPIQESTIFTNPTSIRSGIIFDNRKFRPRYKEFLAYCALMAGLFLFRRRQDYFHQYNEISEKIHCILFKRKSRSHFS